MWMEAHRRIYRREGDGYRTWPVVPPHHPHQHAGGLARVASRSERRHVPPATLLAGKIRSRYVVQKLTSFGARARQWL